MRARVARLQRRALQLRRGAPGAGAEGATSAPTRTPRSCWTGSSATAGRAWTPARACGRSPHTTRTTARWACAATASARSPFTCTATGRRPLLRLRGEVHRRAARPLPRVDTAHLQRYLVNGYKALYKGAQTFFEGVARAAGRHGAAGGRARRRARRARTGSASRSPRSATTCRWEEAVAGHPRATDPLGRAAPARRRPAGLLHERRHRLRLADLHRQAASSTTTSTASRSSTPTSATRSRTWSTRRSTELGLRHTSIPVETTDFLPRLRELVRHHDAPALHDHLLRPLAADAEHRRARLPDLGQRHGRGRAVQRVLRPPPGLPRTPFTGTPALAAASRDGLERARGAGGPQPVPAGPRLLRPRIPAARAHLPRRGRVRRLPARAASTSASPRRAWPTTPAQPDAQRALLRVRPGDPARGRPERHVLLDREPLPVPGPRRCSSSRARSPRGTWSATRSQVGAAGLDARDRPRPDPRQPPQGRLQRARSSTSWTRRPRGARRTCWTTVPVFEQVRREPIEELLALELLPNWQIKFLFNFICAKMFLEEFDDEGSTRPGPTAREFPVGRRGAGMFATWPTRGSTPTRWSPSYRLGHRVRRCPEVLGVLRDAVAEPSAAGPRPACRAVHRGPS